MYLISDGLARLVAPILPVTADELWQHLPGARAESVHLERFPEVAAIADRDLMGTWQQLLAVRAEVNAALEEKRKNKEIGTSLGARVIITAKGPVAAVLAKHEAELPMLFIVSGVELHAGATDGPDEMAIVVERAGA